jgi:hypothetical protein
MYKTDICLDMKHDWTNETTTLVHYKYTICIAHCPEDVVM